MGSRRIWAQDVILSHSFGNVFFPFLKRSFHISRYGSSCVFADKAAYAAVLEETTTAELEPAVKELISLQAEWIIDQSLRDYKRLLLMEAVNQALDRGDREAFIEASRELINFDACQTIATS